MGTCRFHLALFLLPTPLLPQHTVHFISAKKITKIRIDVRDRERKTRSSTLEHGNAVAAQKISVPVVQCTSAHHWPGRSTVTKGCIARQETWPTLPRYATLDLSGSSVVFTRISQCSHRYYQISIDIMRMNKLKKIDNIQKKAVLQLLIFLVHIT